MRTPLVLTAITIISFSLQAQTMTSSMTQADMDQAYRCAIAASVATAAAVEFPNDKKARLRVTLRLAKNMISLKAEGQPLLPTPKEVASALVGIETMLDMKKWDLRKAMDRDIVTGAAASMCTIDRATFKRAK